MGENLKVVWDEFSTLSWYILRPELVEVEAERELLLEPTKQTRAIINSVTLSFQGEGGFQGSINHQPHFPNAMTISKSKLQSLGALNQLKV